MNNYVQI